jgi:uncharacterized glyoxalase superfamily protein PhnB
MTSESPAARSGADDAPEGFIAQSLEAALTVLDLSASMSWYRDVLGFIVDREFRRGDKFFAASMRAGSVRILLTQDDGAKGTEREKGAGFSLQFTTPQSIDGIADRVRSHGVTFDTEPFDMHGVRAFRLRDPDGFKLTISSPRPG